MNNKTMKNMATAILAGSILAALALIQIGCYPGDPLSASDTDVIATIYKAGTNFSVYLTFAMPDSIYRVGDSTLSPNRSYDAQILARIVANMEAAGFTRITDSTTADVFVVALASSSTWVTGSCYPPYWYGWWGYPGGWGWCYPVTYTYKLGSLLTLMIPRTAGPGEQPVWTAGINGVLEGSSAEIAQRLNFNIDQAFKQSPYLNH